MSIFCHLSNVTNSCVLYNIWALSTNRNIISKYIWYIQISKFIILYIINILWYTSVYILLHTRNLFIHTNKHIKLSITCCDSANSSNVITVNLPLVTNTNMS